MAEKIITEESLAEHPEWAEEGLEVGNPEPKQEKKPKAETVVVDRAMLEGILTELAGLRTKVDRVDQLESDNKMLLEVADKSRISTYQSKNNNGTLVRTARVWMWKDKIVKATMTVRNEAFTDNFGRVHTDQVLNIIMEDGSEAEVAYDHFAKEKGLVEADIISRNTNDETGQTFYKMKFKDGKEIEINYLFLN